MDELIENLYSNIMSATEEISDIAGKLASIDGNTMCIGSGGSKVVATFLAKVLSKKNGNVCNTFDPSSILGNINNYKNIVVCSYSGSNYGVKYSLSMPLNSYLFSSRKTKIGNEVLIHYNMEDEHSFISIGATIIPMAILLKYYLGEKFSFYIRDIFSRIEKSFLLNVSSSLNIFTDVSSISAMTFLESSLVEAGIGIPIINYKYDYCHGRSTINKNHENSAILFSRNLDIDNRLSEIIAETMKESIIIVSPYDDDIIDDFYYTLQALYILFNIAKSKGVDLSSIKYDKLAVKGLYYFKGSM